MILTLKKHKKVLLFLLKFFATYFVLFAIYSSYLKRNQQLDPFVNAPVTQLVAKQSAWGLELFGYQVEKVQHPEELSIFLALNGNYVGKIVEGCNSVSLIILFIAFIIAFSGSFKATLLYMLFGTIFIWIINIVRIVVICIMLDKYPEQEMFLHKLLFPAIIYGAVFLLWVIWVNKFSTAKK
ncbi:MULTISPECIES: exosortase family protein XrtF [Tenacibaculum]|uniref:exosortase family protein XrtF n=1 Tax=Tenacibaculum TaxID=104267 RepID=UPI001F0A2A6D|nr:MULTISPECIES: exosortase family protein XrtF [Tenacibaculum]MCH3881923.1 exosortase family protein XrtF [Tenacibaculum aquimarinum]MCH3885838.1 exosortase family protein XrtF [Tenacibaculum aquimarinum]MDO6598507.1 exosortase family protein XrtF [Tenacibaculum sp. 1_MG-2023]